MARKNPNVRFVTASVDKHSFRYNLYIRDGADVAWDDVPIQDSSQVFDCRDLPGVPDDVRWDSVFGQVILYGARKLLEDRTSGSDTHEKIGDRNAYWALFLDGKLRKPAERGPKPPADLISAIMRMNGWDLEHATQQLKAYGPEAWTTMLESEEVRIALAEIAENRADLDKGGLDYLLPKK